MKIEYYIEVPALAERSRNLLRSPEMGAEGKVKIKIGDKNCFNYARNLTERTRNIENLRLEMLREAGVVGLTIPFSFYSDRKFQPGEYVNRQEVVSANQVLETYNALQSIQKMEDADKRTLLEGILLGGSR